MATKNDRIEMLEKGVYQRSGEQDENIIIEDQESKKEAKILRKDNELEELRRVFALEKKEIEKKQKKQLAEMTKTKEKFITFLQK